MSSAISEVVLLDSARFGAPGFLQLRRCEVQNLRADGSRSRTYPLDLVERPVGLDAVVVLPYARDPARVVLRRGLRPVLRLGRCGPERDGSEPPLVLLEAVAGILEAGDEGAEGLRRRAAIELDEELGLRVAPDHVRSLGPPVYASAGILAEQLFFCAVEIPMALDAFFPAAQRALGDGTPMEEGGSALMLSLADALGRCEGGAIRDLKTECALRRLAAELA